MEHAMSDEVERHKVSALRDGQRQTARLDVRQSADETSITIALEDGAIASGAGHDVWQALLDLRGRLDAKGIRLGVTGALQNVWPSGMSAQMSGGRKAYQRQLGDQPVIVEVLSAADPKDAVTVAQHRSWQETFRQEFERRARATSDIRQR
jgi:hypothetical protein